MTNKKVTGVLAIFISPDGVILAKGNHFGDSKPGGYKLQEYQEIMAREQAMWNVRKNIMWMPHANHLRKYTCESIISDLKGNGYRFEYFPIEIELPESETHEHIPKL